MRILPIAFDSFGVRSMATFVETDTKILIDPGVSLAPVRYGLPPHAIELKKLEEKRNEIIRFARKTDILTISHYHYDHYMPDTNIYSGKVLFIKHPKAKQ